VNILTDTKKGGFVAKNIKAARQQLLSHLQEVSDLQATSALLGWDQTTYMPAGGAKARGQQIATLQRLAHEKFTSATIGRLLDQLQPYAESLPNDHDDAAWVRFVRRQYERTLKVPNAYAATIAQHGADSYTAWAAARPANDFGAVIPYLAKTLDLSRQFSDFFPGYQHIADPLIDSSDYGMSVATIQPLFAELRQQLAKLVQTITSQPAPDDSCLHQAYPEAEQLAFGERVIRAYGYDFTRGRQDRTLHPYMTKFSIGDVRITTRIKADDLSEALFSTLHESGHALYELGFDPELEGTLLDNGTSAGVHESQSRLWENLVGRSLGFWQHYYPQLQAAFPQQLGQTSLDSFYRAINKVQRSLIRTDADEVTYNLHVIIRFELELALLEGKLAIADLPDAWHAAYQQNLGITAPDDRDGVLQDVHWYAGRIGGQFQGYTLGNILSAQFFAAACRAHPEIPAEIGVGQFGTLHTWLRTNIYQHGSKFTTDELINRVTGSSLQLTPYLTYLRTKYGALYQL
jgi:carboxypeptidase Taq